MISLPDKKFWQRALAYASIASQLKTSLKLDFQKEAS